MEERKLVKSGLSSFTIALPKDWVERNKLTKGSSVFCEEESDRLILLPKKVKEKKSEEEKILLIDDISIKSLSRDLVANYLKNTGIIKLKGKELMSKLTEIKTVLSQLAGLEVIEETGDTLVLKDFIDIDEISLLNLLRRNDNVLRSMFTDTINCISSVNPELSEAVRLRDKEVNRLVFLIYKGLNYLAEHPQEASNQGIKPTNFMHLWELNNHLEKIGDEVKRIAMNSAKAKLGKNDILQIKPILEEVQEIYVQVMTATYKHDIFLSDKYAAQINDVQETCDKYLQTSKSIENRKFVARMRYLLSHINDISRLIRYFSFGKETEK
jgi:phosphate uptake regulator